MATTTIKDGAWVASINPGETATFSTAKKYVDKNISVQATAQTVGNGTITISQNGTSVGSFSVNQSSDKTISFNTPVIYSGTSTPSASLGKNGDIYIKLV